MHYLDARRLRAPYLPLKERIHAYIGPDGVLRAIHILRLQRLHFPTLHDKIVSKPPSPGETSPSTTRRKSGGTQLAA